MALAGKGNGVKTTKGLRCTEYGVRSSNRCRESSQGLLQSSEITDRLRINSKLAKWLIRRLVELPPEGEKEPRTREQTPVTHSVSGTPFLGAAANMETHVSGKSCFIHTTEFFRHLPQLEDPFIFSSEDLLNKLCSV
jgi:hypothetical protein